MKIAVDISPLVDDSIISHRARGTGFYIHNLKKSLLEYFSNNKYIFFTRGESLPSVVDIIHYPYFEPFFLTLPFRKVAKTVITVHDLTPFVFKEYFPSGLRGSIKWWIQKRFLQRSDAIITDSECSKADIIKYTGISESKITVVYLAAGEEFKQVQSSKLEVESFRKKYNLPEKFVLYVGDVTWNKNLPRLIEAVIKTNIPLVLVGKAIAEKDFDKTNLWNRDLDSVQKLIEENKNILSLGFVSSDELVLLYNIATVFCMPSLYEGFGLPILEAMQCGCPVVTTREGSIPEIIGDAGLYVDAYDVSSIAKGLKEVFSNSNLQHKISKRGLERAKKFSWEKTAKETFQVYKKAYEKNH